MPPWHADPRYGHFSNDRSLSERERSTLLAWVEQGCAARRPLHGARTTRTSPGLVDRDAGPRLRAARDIQGPSRGTPADHALSYTDEPQGRLWIQAAEARPSDRAVVHHIFVYTEKYHSHITGQKEKIFLAAYLPGDVLSVYPPGVAKKIPAGSDLVFEVHYTPIGKVRFDRSSVGIIVSKTPPRHLAITRGIAAHGLRIPPGAPDHVERAEWNIKQDIHILSFSPHMHLRGKSFIYKALLSRR